MGFVQDITRSYNSWQEWLAYVSADTSDGEGSYIRSSQTRHPAMLRHFTSERAIREFYGTATFAEAMQLARRGWPEGARKAQAFGATLVDRIVGRVEREDIAFDVEGTQFDVARMLTNEPEHWTRWETTQEASHSIGNKCISICLNGSVHWMIARDVIVARGAAVVALANLLEYAGYNVEITLAFRTEYRGALTSLITLKRYGEPSDMATVAFALAHPSSARRLNFAAKERESNDMRELLDAVASGCYGYPRDLPEAQQSSYSVYINAGNESNGFGAWNDPNASEQWVLDKLANAGVRLLDAEGK